jgi:DNA-binding Lrp family transcriptional regulator
LTIELTRKHLSVLIALQENPLATFEWLSKRVGMSKSIVYGIIQDLLASEKPFFSVVANSNLWNLGLENHDVLVAVDDNETIKTIETKLCYNHPYTIYHARCFGNTNGMLIQFTMPLDSKHFLKELFDAVQQKQFIQEYTILPFHNSQAIYSAPNVDFWNPEVHKWEFNWEEWFTAELKPFSLPTPNGEPGKVKEWLTTTDVRILRELTKNARRKNVEIIDALNKAGYEMTPQTFSRRLKMIKKHCVANYRVFLNPTVFDLYSSILIHGSGKKKDIEDLQKRMLDIPIPFSSTFKTNTNNQLFWYIHLPPSHLSDLLYYLRNRLSDMRFYYVDFNRAQSYLPWPPTFQEEKQQWNQEKSFLVDEVLKKLES